MSGASPQRGLLDTPVLIDIRTGDANAFAVALLRGTGIEVSELSAMINITRCIDATELQRELAFLGNCQVRRITAAISRRAFRLLASLPPPCGLTAGDAIVAATAVEHNLPLYSLDASRFAAVPGLTALRPY